MKKVYLAGLISTERPDSLRWRVTAEVDLNKIGVIAVSPMRGKQDLVKTSRDGGITDPALTSKDVILRDFADIKNCDVVLVNLNFFDSERPLVGTFFELAWAWEHRIPVVAIAAEPLMVNHPFVREAVSHYCDTLDDAIEILKRHWSN